MKKKFTSYLKNITFDPKLYNSLHARYITNIRFVALLIITIFSIGAVSLVSLPRRLNPEIKIPIVSIATVMSGASPEDVESLVSVPLEEKLAGIKGLDSMTSVSRDSVSLTVLQFVSSVDPAKAEADVKSIVDSVSDLPDDAETPQVQALDFENQPVWTFAVTSKQDEASLMRFAKILKEKLVDLPKVDRVVLSGFDTQEIQVVLDANKMRYFGVHPFIISQAIQKAVNSYPAGTVKTGASAFSLNVDADITSISDIRSLRLTLPSRQTIRLSDIARVEERSKPDESKSFLASRERLPKQSVMFSVFKTSAANIDETTVLAKETVNKTVTEYNHRFEIDSILNTGEEIVREFDDLFSEFRSTIILVFINLLLFLGLRQALIASFTIPLTFLCAFALMGAMGMSLNFLSLFSLLLALGLNIDDTIVTVAAMTTYYKTGKFSPKETGLLVWRDFIVPIWSTTITTIWAFIPLLLSTGIIGEFIKPIPIVVTATMMSSTGIAVLITLPLMIFLLKPSLKIKKLFLVEKLSSLFSKKGTNGKAVSMAKKLLQEGLIDTDKLSRNYQRLIGKIISSKKIVEKL